MTAWKKPEPFLNKEDIKKYYSGDRIQCLVCGKWFKSLGVHLNKTHNMSIDDYKKMFGLPWSIGLCSSETAKKFQRNAKMLREKGFLLTGIISEEHEKKVHKKGSRRITPAHSKDRSDFFKKLGLQCRCKHLDLKVCKQLESEGLIHKEIGKYFGVSQGTISRFMRGGNKYQQQEGGTE